MRGVEVQSNWGLAKVMYVAKTNKQSNKQKNKQKNLKHQWGCYLDLDLLVSKLSELVSILN